MAGNYDTPLLDLETLIERPKITIDGEPYEIVSPDELSVIEIQRLASLGRKLDNLLRQDGEAQPNQLTKALELLTATIMAPVPADIRGKLSDGHKRAVIEVFTMLSLGRKMQLAGATMPQIVKALTGGTATTGDVTGGKPRRGSSDTTAATPPAG